MYTFRRSTNNSIYRSLEADAVIGNIKMKNERKNPSCLSCIILRITNN